MKLKTKGFTMIELLATVVILGILAGISTPLVSRYLTKARENNYEHMFTGAYDAVNNYIIEENKTVTRAGLYMKLSDLVAGGYLESLEDPGNLGGNHCDGVIKVEPFSSTGLKTYIYTCLLVCNNYSKAVKWENGAAAKDYMEDTSSHDALSNVLDHYDDLRRTNPDQYLQID